MHKLGLKAGVFLSELFLGDDSLLMWILKTEPWPKRNAFEVCRLVIGDEELSADVNYPQCLF